MELKGKSIHNDGQGLQYPLLDNGQKTGKDTEDVSVTADLKALALQHASLPNSKAHARLTCLWNIYETDRGWPYKASLSEFKRTGTRHGMVSDTGKLN